jgi:hypothetical protein
MSELYVEKVLGLKETNLSRKQPYWKAITAEQRRNATTHCGPDESYPLGPGCEHVRAAWTLAMSGHGSPNMACIKRYATTHGCYVPPSHKGPNSWQVGF